MTNLAIKPQEHIRPYGPTAFKTERNQHEVRCGICGRFIYVDDETFGFMDDAIKAGIDDPFHCEQCKEGYDDLAYEV